jgi:predicted MFS family arabinose efflux permease
MPVIGSLISDCVDREHLPAAVALNAVGQNASRVVGPALAGTLIGLGGPIATIGAAAALLLLSGLTLAAAVPPDARAHGGLSLRRLVDDARQEWSTTARTPWKRNLLLRLSAFFLCTSAVPALLPVKSGSGTTYGLMLALYGAGALGSLLVLGPPRSQAAIERRLRVAQSIHAAGLLVLGTTSGGWITAGALLTCGATWLAVSNGMMTAAQLQLPAEARGRGLSMVYAVGMGGLALGGPLWGSIASRFDVGSGFIAAAAVSLALLLLTGRRRITTESAREVRE